MTLLKNISLVLAASTGLVAYFWPSLSLRAEVLGMTRAKTLLQNLHGEDFYIIPDTLHCEDLHHHLPSGLLFGASEVDPETRWKWFPPIGEFDYKAATTRGSFVVINPETKSSKRLTLTGFNGPFVTHGIDIWSSKDEPNSVYIFAVNHLANPAYVASKGKIQPEARSQIEVFHYTIGTSEAKHLRSIWHPLIRTPNDIYARDRNSIFVTNDHKYRDGLMRYPEDLVLTSAWSDIVYIEISDMSTKKSSERINVTSIKHKMQNPNGLGHGKNENDILVVRAAAGILEMAHLDEPFVDPVLHFTQSVQFNYTLDNPSYFRDPYAKETGRDASGYVMAGLNRASKFPNRKGDPSIATFAPEADSQSGERILFLDDGKMVSTASTAVLVAIDPKKNGGNKQAWLFVTGPMTAGIASMKVDL
jgi:hypothetical protein